MKTIEDNFADWEGDTFGYGYGTGEAHTLPALKAFLELCPSKLGGSPSTYDYLEMERELSPVVAWLMINILARANIIEYGSSPRFGWLSSEGMALQNFVKGKSIDELCELTPPRDEKYIHCYPNACNCDGDKCKNPFWVSHS